MGLSWNGVCKETSSLVENINVIEGSKFYSKIVDEIEKSINKKIKRHYGFLPHVTLKIKNDNKTLNIKDHREFKWIIEKCQENHDALAWGVCQE